MYSLWGVYVRSKYGREARDVCRLVVSGGRGRSIAMLHSINSVPFFFCVGKGLVRGEAVYMSGERRRARKVRSSRGRTSGTREARQGGAE